MCEPRAVPVSSGSTDSAATTGINARRLSLDNCTCIPNTPSVKLQLEASVRSYPMLPRPARCRFRSTMAATCADVTRTRSPSRHVDPLLGECPVVRIPLDAVHAGVVHPHPEHLHDGALRLVHRAGGEGVCGRADGAACTGGWISVAGAVDRNREVEVDHGRGLAPRRAVVEVGDLPLGDDAEVGAVRARVVVGSMTVAGADVSEGPGEGEIGLV